VTAGTDPSEFEQVGNAFDRVLLRRLGGLARPDAFGFVQAFVLLIAIAGLEVLLPWILRLAVDGPVAQSREIGLEQLIANQGERSELFTHVAWLAGAALAVAAALLAARFAQFMIVQRSGQRVLHRIRSAVFQQIERLPIAYFDRTATGRLVSRVTNDIETLNELFTSGIINLIGDVLKVIALLGAALWIHPLLALIGALAVPAIGIASAFFRIRARQGYRETRSTIARVTAYLAESISGIRVIQAFAREDLARSRFAERCNAFLAANLKTVFYFALFFPVVDGLTLAAQGAVFWQGGNLILGSELTIGQFLQLWFYLGLMFEPLREMAEKYNVLQSAMASAERVFQVLDEAPEAPDPPDAATLDGFREQIRFDQVDFEYAPGVQVLRNVDLEVRRGEMVALVGPTGGGKTTLSALLTRFYEPTHGRILIDGLEIARMKRASLRSLIAYVPQDPFLFTGTILENLILGNPAVTPARAKAAIDAIGASPFVSRFERGFDHILTERGSNLSAGERQIIAFARALALDPQILVLDEATANIDPDTEQLIQLAITRLLAGRTSIVIAHRLSTIRRADRIAVIQRGEIREQGTHDQLMRVDGIYRKLHRVQFSTQNSGAPDIFVGS
jgi:ATP-binding cassette, subfamily B, multidrug efflux pump